MLIAASAAMAAAPASRLAAGTGAPSKQPLVRPPLPLR